ncbi:MAG: DUF4380 domain-containing protein [bacterium]|nr:DUF4380 domain-containing protein [bacterium]
MHTTTFAACCFSILLSSPGAGNPTCGAHHPAVRDVRLTFRGWTNAYRLANDTVELIAVPQIGGRIMHYSFLGGQNVVREVPSLWGVIEPLRPDWQYVNYGGCKLWAAPQCAFPNRWPPNAYWENGRCTAAMNSPLCLQLVGPRDPAALLQFTRTVTLAPSGSLVRLDHRMENLSSATLTRSIWAVNQQPRPSLLLAPRPPSPHRVWGTNLHLWLHTDDVYYTEIQTNLASKLFVLTERPWCAGLHNRLLWIVWGEPPTQLSYPQGEAPVEIYCEASYAELEILSPAFTLAPGQAGTYTMFWSLTKTPDNSLAAALAALRAHGFLP